MTDSKVVLIVEDQRSLLEALVDAVESLGHTVKRADSGRAALDHARRDKPDLVLLDLGLPDMPGEAVLEALLAEHAGLRIVIITGRPDAEADAIVKRAAGVIHKPIRLELLTAIVQAALG